MNNLNDFIIEDGVLTQYKGNDIEGFVIEDSVGYMTKLKLFYYKYWKKNKVYKGSFR